MNITELVNKCINESEYDEDCLIKISECEDFICDGSCKRLLKVMIEDKAELYKFKYSISCGLCLNKNFMKNGLKYIDRVDYSEEERP